MCTYQISDDEDDTHPNIDTPSLFRWRHQARIERMEERKREQEEHERKKAEYVQHNFVHNKNILVP